MRSELPADRYVTPHWQMSTALFPGRHSSPPGQVYPLIMEIDPGVYR